MTILAPVVDKVSVCRADIEGRYKIRVIARIFMCKDRVIAPEVSGLVSWHPFKWEIIRGFVVGFQISGCQELDVLVFCY